jgi:hypothetical protein
MNVYGFHAEEMNGEWVFVKLQRHHRILTVIF